LLYLLDANTIIESSTKYYQIARVKPFWDWLLFHAQKGSIPSEIYEEILHGKKDDFINWFGSKEVRKILEFPEKVNTMQVRRVISEGYGPDLNDVQIEKVGRDPILISYALDHSDRCIVTQEIPGNHVRQNQKIPTVCHNLSIASCNIFEVINTLNFSIDWQSEIG
jgi:hypothetical protein